MRLKILIAVLAVAAPTALHAGSAPFEGQSVIFGRHHVYQGAWCGHQDVGGNHVEEDCSFDSFEHCRFAVMGVNNGFCTPNPAFTGRYHPTRKKKKRRAHR